MKARLTKDQKDLKSLESRARRGFRGWSETLLALREIHGRQLYRLVSPDWRQYLRDRFALWGEKRRVNQLITATEIFLALDPASPAPTSEAQTRALAALPPDIQRELWSQATAAGDSPTAAELERVVDVWQNQADKDREVAEIQREETKCLKELGQATTPVKPGRDLINRIGELLGRVEKLLRRVDMAAEAEGLVDVLAKIQELAATLRQAGIRAAA
jgi:hypothetical protein